MPDADDFDVESLRSLLSGGSAKPQPARTAPAKKSGAARAGKKAAPPEGKRPAKPRRKP